MRLSLALLVLALLGWAGLVLWERAVRASLAGLDAREKKILEERSTADLQEAEAAASRLASLTERINAHTLSSKFLSLLEGLAHPRVQFASLNATIRTGEVTLRGEAASLGVLAESLDRWLRNPEVRGAAIPELARRESSTSFRAELTLRPSAFVR